MLRDILLEYSSADTLDIIWFDTRPNVLFRCSSAALFKSEYQTLVLNVNKLPASIAQQGGFDPQWMRYVFFLLSRKTPPHTYFFAFSGKPKPLPAKNKNLPRKLGDMRWENT